MLRERYSFMAPRWAYFRQLQTKENSTQCLYRRYSRYGRFLIEISFPCRESNPKPLHRTDLYYRYQGHELYVLLWPSNLSDNYYHLIITNIINSIYVKEYKCTMH